MGLTTTNLPALRTIALKDLPDDKCVALTFLIKDVRAPIVLKDMQSELLKLGEYHNSQRLLIDFTGVEAVSSAVFGLVLKVAAEGHAKGVTVRVCSMTPQIKNAFTMVRSTEHVAIFDTSKQAIETSWEAKKSWWPF